MSGGLTRWSDLARLYTPVLAAPQPRTRPVPLVQPDPDSGARWGKLSAFSWSNEAATLNFVPITVNERTFVPVGILAGYVAAGDITWLGAERPFVSVLYKAHDS